MIMFIIFIGSEKLFARYDKNKLALFSNSTMNELYYYSIVILAGSEKKER